MASQSPADQKHHEDVMAAPGAAHESSQGPAGFTATVDDSKRKDDGQAVRFASTTEEIHPDEPAADPATELQESSTFTEVAADQVRAFTKSVQGKPLQERRINTFQFEAFSLPPSRVPSREDDSGEATRVSTPTSPAPHSQSQSQPGSPRLAGMASPPLTPSGSDPTGALARKSSKETESKAGTQSDPQTITPAQSSSNERSPVVTERRPFAHRPASSDQIVQRPSSAEEQHDDYRSHRRTMFGIGPESVPVSRDSSPTRSSASHFYSKPMTPQGDINDPYAKGRRPPQQHSTTRHSIDPRFVFSRKKKHGSPSSSRTSLTEKRSSGVFGAKNANDDLAATDSSGVHGSMSDLKRFFRKPGHHHHKKQDSAPYATRPGTATPPAARSTQQLPFGEDHGLTTKYGKLGRVLGSGAGGSVRLMKRKEDGTVFAVKEFRARHTYETEKEYNKKVTAEFCVGSTLHHGNIIETLDIMQEKGRWFEVMEYAPFDLFAIVMTGKMSREEVRCCFLQIFNGVTYLHSLGLAHRDLKLDNVVVSDKGIMKIIDFGSAHVFKYPFESGTVLAKGIVGSDPYLAPEVYDSKEYDAAAVDIWSLAIIYCCMTLRRFPWKIPRMSDNSFKLFASEPTPGHDPKKLLGHAKSTSDLANTPARDFIEASDSQPHQHDEKNDHHHSEKTSDTASTAQPSTVPPSTAAPPTARSSLVQPSNAPIIPSDRKEIIKGPWRILRLLPRESRHIVHRMLDMNPKKRATMDEILQESWIADAVICQQLEVGEVIPADDHTHILEPPAAQPKPT